MATYYRWRQSNPKNVETTDSISRYSLATGVVSYTLYLSDTKPSMSNGRWVMTNVLPFTEIPVGETQTVTGYVGIATGDPNNIHTVVIGESSGKVTIEHTSENSWVLSGGSYPREYMDSFSASIGPGTRVGYVYSTNSSAYPNGGVQGDYYYDQRTTITSPTAPTNLQYPNPITTPTVTVSWGASTSNIPSYSVSNYEISYATNGLSNWTVAATQSGTSYTMDTPTGVSSIQFRVRAKDSNGRWSSYTTGTSATILLAPTLTVPSLAMQGEDITVNWTAIDGATSYTLQRKANTDDGWVQVYSGPNLTFTETVGTWASVQYQVQAVFSSGAGGWATSASIPVVSASALVISGTDEDLGTLTADVPYTISSDTGNPITLTRTVNGNVVATLTVQSGFAYTIPVMDLPTGSGTIEISASVTATSGPVSATRTWTYTKTAISFPNSASVGQLNQDGTNIFPATLAEVVKVPTHWGGTLDKALELLYDAANSAVISVGTYEGSGTYGVDNPNTLTISPSPQVVTIYGGGQTLVISSTDTSSPAYIDGTTVKWYSTVSAADQMNTSGVTYSYVAVAKGVTA